MKFKNHIITFFIFIFTTSFLVSFSQTRTIDSLRNVLKTEKEDTDKVTTLNTLGAQFRSQNPDTAILLDQEAILLSEKLNWRIGEAHAYNNLGLSYQIKGNHPKAIYNYFKALEIAEALGNKMGQAAIFCNIGNNYHDESDDVHALEYDQKSLKIAEDIGYKHGQANVLGNIGLIHEEQGNYQKAVEYYLKSLKIYEEIGEKLGQAACLGNIGIIYDDESDYPMALDYYLKALKIDESIDNKNGQAADLGNIGVVYAKESRNSEALNYFLKALNIADEIKNKHWQALNLGNIGELYAKTGKFKEAEEYLNKAFVIDSSIDEKQFLQKCEQSLSNLYNTTGRYKLALDWYKKAMTLKDTLFNLNKDKDLTRKELTFKFERQSDSAKAAQDKKDALAASDKKKQDVITASVSVGLLLVLVFSGMLFSRFRITQRQKKLIEEQKNVVEKQKEEVEYKNVLIETQKKLVEEKNKDILDSITYAKRLQDAILPPLSLVEKYFPESFVLFQPKDIVAGDFYWLERASDTLLIAAADCTGHGVPGALVSVVCSNALNRAVKEFHITEPGKILDKVRELVLETFEKSEGSIQDGMDISLLTISPVRTGTGGHQPIANKVEIQWAGAYNSLWYVENGEIKEIPADKQPIGKTDNLKPFTTHTISLEPPFGGQGGCGGTFYLFTDGFADQFGGPKSKKYKYKQLQEKLLAINYQPLAEQKAELEKEFEQWKGTMEQTDDVCVIGIRV